MKGDKDRNRGRNQEAFQQSRQERLVAGTRAVMEEVWRSGQILVYSEVESTGFPDRLGVECEGEGGVEGDSRGFGPSNRKYGLGID